MLGSVGLRVTFCIMFRDSFGDVQQVQYPEWEYIKHYLVFPSLPEFPGVFRKQVSISQLPELEQDLPKFVNPQFFMLK